MKKTFLRKCGAVIHQQFLAQSARVVVYTDCISVKVYDPQHDSSYGEASVMLEFWEMQSTPLLPLFPGLLYPGVVAPDVVLSMVK